MSRHGIRRIIARETLLALLVLALGFLNFGHASISSAGEFTLTPDSWCNDPLVPASAEHSPCHACRIGGGADLPPPPAGVVPVCFAAVAISYADMSSGIVLERRALTANPRAPPIA